MFFQIVSLPIEVPAAGRFTSSRNAPTKVHDTTCNSLFRPARTFGGGANHLE